MTDARDVVIIGGGAMGGAVATFLLDDPAFAGSVTVIERDPTFRTASSALSAAGIRQQFSTPENIRMSRFSFDWIRDTLGITIHEGGYLYLAPPGSVDAIEQNHAVQRAEGADVELLDATELVARFPWMSADGVGLASLGRSGEGWFDGYALLQALRSRARAAGAALVTGEVTGLTIRDGRVGSVRLGDGTAIPCGTVVNAAGPWARSVAAMADVDLPVEARRRSVFVFDVEMPPSRLPARDRHVRRVVPARGRRLHRGLRPAVRGRPRGPAARRGPRPVRGLAVAGAGGPRAGVRCGPGHQRLGGLLRDEHVRPQRDHRPASGRPRTCYSSTASADTASSRHRPPVAPSPS